MFDLRPPEVLILALMLAIVAAGVVFVINARRNEARRKARVAAITNAYQEALDYLASHPADPQARLACLEHGRAYYAMTIPDTFTAVIGRAVFGTQDYQNNTAGREARIAADIEARVGHLKVKGTA
jgi:hypothetical protein